MVIGLDILSATTNFYRLAKVTEVKYVVFNSNSNEDQLLLDAEIQLRKANPKVLALLYSKELWTFSINSEEPPSPAPEFNFTGTETKTFEPQNMFKSNSGTPASLMNLLCSNFIKAVRKMLVLTLASRKEMIPFGNAGLLPDGQHFLQIEPKLVETGELLVSLTTKEHNFSQLAGISPTLEDFNTTHTIYLAPSGIRAYLTGSTIEESTVDIPPNAASIAESLDSLHNIQIDPDSCRWITLIPNLSHLNGMTAPIADFFKRVPNSKFLTWPLELCLAQKGERIREEEVDWKDEFNDPLSLIDSFVKLKASATTKTPSNMPTANNTPADFEAAHHPLHHVETPSAKPTPDTVGSSLVPDIQEETVEDPNSTKEGDVWDDDLDAELFGDDDGGDDADSFDLFNEPPKDQFTSTNEQSTEDLLMLDDDLQADLASELEMLAGQDDDDEPVTENADDTEDPYDIPLHEMTIPNTPPYTDPGAPLPVQSPKASQRKRSIFSPLNFNPIIKSNVDDKYANGGKFHVPSDTPPTAGTGAGGDSGIPTLMLDETFGKDEGDDDDSEDEDDDEDDEDDEGEEGDSSESDSSQISDDLRLAVASADANTSNALEMSSEPDLKRIKLGTPTLQNLETLAEKPGSLSPPSMASNGTPNVLPFLLRMIPLQSMPQHVFVDNPVVKEEISADVVNTLLEQIVWDDGCLSDLVPSEAVFEQNHSDDLERAIAQIFPDFHAVSLAEYSGIPYSKPMKVDAESPLSSFKAPDYSQNEFITSGSPPMKVPSPQDTTDDYPKSCFLIPQPKVKVKRLNQEISVNASALHLWNMMSFTSLRPAKDFRAIMLSPQELTEQSEYFLTSFSEVYEKCHLGAVEKMSLPQGLKNGVISADYESDQFEETVLSYCRSLHQVLSRGSNYKDIVIVLPDYDRDLKSAVDLAILFEKMRRTLVSTSNGRKLGIKVHLKIIPSTFITNNGVFSILSISKLTRLSLTLYNTIGDPDQTFTSLSTPLPTNIKFQLTDRPVAQKILSEDSFIHLAYERSADKEWCVATWIDNKCKFRKVRAWSGATRNKDSLEKVMDDIWDVTLDIAAHLPGKKYLVLTRMNGMIADDELLQLKRLSSKSKEITLVVVSVNRNPRLLLKANEAGYPYNKLFNQDDGFNGVTSNKMESAATVGSSTGMTPSIFTPQAVNSPDLFTLGKTTGAHDSPSEARGGVIAEEGSIIQDITDTVHGLITEYASPLANTPARLSVKTGFLIKPMMHSNNKLEAFEVNLLSCPSTFSSWDLMHLLLTQLRNMATMGELYGVVEPRESLVPLHVAAVEKAIKCLVHVRVEKP